MIKFYLCLLRDSGQLTMPEVKRVLLIGFNISIKGKMPSSENLDKMRSLLQLAFYLLDKLRRFKLSKEVCKIHFATISILNLCIR